MRMDNNGEGGIMALMSLLVHKGKDSKWVTFSALTGAALIYRRWRNYARYFRAFSP